MLISQATSNYKDFVYLSNKKRLYILSVLLKQNSRENDIAMTK